jgi:hypothetical protein
MRVLPIWLGASLLVLPAAFAASPRVGEPPPPFEFGETAPGQAVRHVFAIRNVGDAPLELTAPSMPGRVSLVAPPAPIAPGAEAKLEAVFDALGQTDVVVEERLRLRTNDADRAVVDLVFRGAIRALVAAKPGYARWNTVQGEPEATIAQTLYATDGTDFKILSVTSEYPHLETTVRAARPDERVAAGPPSQWRLELTLPSWPAVGPITGDVLVETDHPKQKQLRLPLSGFVRPMLFVDPPTGALGELNVASTARRSFRVRVFGTTPAKVTKAEVTVPGAVVSDVRPLQEGRLYEVALAFTPDTPNGPFAGKLRIHTDSSKLPVYEIDLTGTAAGGSPSTAAEGTASIQRPRPASAS